VLLAVRKGAIPSLTTEREDVPAPLDTVIQQALAHSPEERFQTATEMARALASVLRTTTEQTDAEPLGASVRAARERLGKSAPSTAGQVAAAPLPDVPGALEPMMSAENLSMSDVEVLEVELRQKKPIDKPPVQPLPSEPVLRGLWQGDDKSVALPLTRKKDE
jgi:hypothetical protein